VVIPIEPPENADPAADGTSPGQPAAYKLAVRRAKSQATVVRAGGLSIGGRQIGLIAGPCAVESPRQTLATARAVAAAGAAGLRGGAFKARTSPYSFQGLKEEGLKILADARDETGLAVVAEVVAAGDVALVARYADMLQIGARNMQNYRLLEAVGKQDKPVLLKRGPSATLDELLLAAEYILSAGNPGVALCERGIPTFETHTRYTLSLASVPWLRERTHLPVVVDPSHGTGRASLVGPMAAAAVAAGADALLVEVHPDPAAALSDGYQSLDFEQFSQLAALCRRVAEAVGRPLAAAANGWPALSGEGPTIERFQAPGLAAA
jgi:3-deoxy-7-phosphoheptulonate synthase